MPADKNIYSSVKSDLCPLISVIVPIYKVEKYLDRCINSIVNQTYRNLEIILVDDGSPDKCPLMCDEWQKKDERIKVIHKENGGLSSARNAGLDIATGEYIAFVDSDDYILPDMYEYLYRLIDENDADFSMCEFMYADEKGLAIDDNSDTEDEKIDVLSGDEALEEFVMRNWHYVLAWNKLYRKHIFRNLRFPEGKLHEDDFIAHIIIYQCIRIAYTTRKYYMYTQRDDSIMGDARNTFRVRHMADTLSALTQKYYFLRNKGMYDFADRVLIERYRFIRKMLCQGSYIKHFWEFNREIFPVIFDYLRSRGIKMKLRPARLILDVMRNITRDIYRKIKSMSSVHNRIRLI